MSTSAAAQVFALPELLEHSLIELAAETKSASLPKPAPPHQLFTLQRVNSTFHDVIQRSEALREIMFHEPKSTNLETEGGLDAFDPLLWLLGKFVTPGTRPKPEMPGEEPYILILIHCHTVHGIRFDYLQPCWNVGASWRKIRATKVNPWERLHVVFNCTYTLPNGKEDELGIKYPVRIAADITLGEALDELEKCVMRCIDERTPEMYMQRSFDEEFVDCSM